MTAEELVAQSTRIMTNAKVNFIGSLAEARQFLTSYGGSSSNHFLEALKGINPSQTQTGPPVIVDVMTSFVAYVKSGLLKALSMQREIQIETVSEYLSQAETLLNDSKVHAAAPAVLIGASLEQFLRDWLQEEGCDLSTIPMSIDSYSKELRAREKITKQDAKDILGWGGIRNDAAHGHWGEVNDPKRIKLMLEGVNLFIRKYSSEN